MVEVVAKVNSEGRGAKAKGGGPKSKNELKGQFLVVVWVQSEFQNSMFEAILGPVSSRGWGPK